MLWIALYLPELPLQFAQRGARHEQALVIADGPGNRPLVCCANEAARDLGVKPGMTIAAARALAVDMVTLSRDPNGEAQALQNLAVWAYQFTPGVVIHAAGGLLLEVEAALKLHKGLANLLARIRQDSLELGYRIVPGVAPTPVAAWLFARARHAGCAARTCTDSARLPDRLRDIPLALLDWPQDVLRHLAGLGITRIGQCLALPRDGFTKRFGKEALLDLDKALGSVPDPRPCFIPPDTFSCRAEFGFEASDALMLLFPLNKLLKELEGYLRGRGVGVQQWRLVLEHSARRTSVIAMGTVAPERDAGRLLALARERLGRVALSAPALAIRVEAEEFFTFEERTQSWLPEEHQSTANWHHLIDKLASRLGGEKIYRLQAVDEHRPEKSARRIAAAAPKSPALPRVRSPRPLWLLAPPRDLLTENGQPLCQGRLELIAGPERIESGWWDGRPVGRDYYVARNPHGETLWIYREHRHRDAWYLHGLFA